MKHQANPVALSFPPTAIGREVSRVSEARLVVALSDMDERFRDAQWWVDMMIEDIDDIVDTACTSLGIVRPAVQFDVEFARDIAADGVEGISGDSVAELWSDDNGDHVTDVTEGVSPDLKIMAALLLHALDRSVWRDEVVSEYEAGQRDGLMLPKIGGEF
jgi:hypothetical protein